MEYGKIEHCLLFMRNVRCILETNTRKIKPNIDKYIKETKTQIYKRNNNSNIQEDKKQESNINKNYSIEISYIELTLLEKF